MVDHLDVDRLSDAVDGRSSPEDLSHLAGCQACQTRLEGLQAASKAVGVAPEVPEAARQSAVEAALGAAASVFVGPDTGSPVTPLAAVPEPTRRLMTPRTARILAAAAGVALVGGIAAGVSQIGPDRTQRDERAATGTVAPIPSGASKQSGPTVIAPSAQAAGGVANSTAVLGSYGDMASVVRDVRGAAAYSSSAAATTPAPTANALSGVAACQTSAARAAGLAPGDRPLYEASLRYQSRPAAVYVFAKAGRRIAVVEAVASCAVLGTASF